uniref:Uncharacterized protein n=1 Tax=Aegilops tauschii TaxID=37682 RepID=M8BNP9_AEGTA
MSLPSPPPSRAPLLCAAFLLLLLEAGQDEKLVLLLHHMPVCSLQMQTGVFVLPLHPTKCFRLSGLGSRFWVQRGIGWTLLTQYDSNFAYICLGEEIEARGHVQVIVLWSSDVCILTLAWSHGGGGEGTTVTCPNPASEWIGAAGGPAAPAARCPLLVYNNHYNRHVLVPLPLQLHLQGETAARSWFPSLPQQQQQQADQFFFYEPSRMMESQIHISLQIINQY